ncbi:EcsC family protein [Kribbella sp. NBC_00709]|uniref:EcsC family protein n=1 Tax=Kribbella sp. NBC_00709 TaxID=2975972 RepID=UPI002E2E4B65|nr:EcsC family protein [Kribbella sp. NBC_00709]
MGFEEMSAYEQAAWRQSLKVLHESPRQPVIPKMLRERVSSTTSWVAGKVSDLPGADSAKDIVERVFEGTLALTFQPALRSTRPASIVKRYAKQHPETRTHEHIRALPLEDRDAMLPPKFGYTLGSAGQGAATALAVTGAEVATTVTAGTTAAVAIGAVAADAVASMAMMGRTIGAVASRYGYDVRLPDEELFAMGVLSLGVAGSLGAKTQALGALSRLTQQMMRQATWKQLNEHLLVRVIGKVYQILGLRLTQKKLAQTVPFVGVGLNAALSASLTERTFRRAQAVYRLRTLSETYGIDPQEWMSGSSAARSDNDAGEGAVDVMAVLDAERDAPDS